MNSELNYYKEKVDELILQNNKIIQKNQVLLQENIMLKRELGYYKERMINDKQFQDKQKQYMSPNIQDKQYLSPNIKDKYSLDKLMQPTLKSSFEIFNQ